MSDHENDDAASFFFSSSNQNQKEEEKQTTTSEKEPTTSKNLQQDAASNNFKNTNTKNVAALLSAQDVLDMSSNLVFLASEAPKAFSALQDKNTDQQQQQLPQISISELRRQQTKLVEWSEKVVFPLSKLVVRWEEEVVLNFEDLLSYLFSDDDDESDERPKNSVSRKELENAFKNGNLAMDEINKKKYSKKLKEMVDEKKRELRLCENLLNCGVWEDL
jgi:hypothetical protein